MGPGVSSSTRIPKPSSLDSENPGNPKKRWTNLMPCVIALVVIAEIAFLGRLDMSKNAAMVNLWADSLLHRSYFQTTEAESARRDVDSVGYEDDSCEKWLMKEDDVVYNRDFDKDPIVVAGGDQV
jgi:glycoprotein 3-alpha-L-fucosyltransferase